MLGTEYEGAEVLLDQWVFLQKNYPKGLSILLNGHSIFSADPAKD